MNKDFIIENNLAIAKFMGATESNYFDGTRGIVVDNPTGKIIYSPDNLRYHLSWDWLMPVVDKISKEYYKEHNKSFPIVVRISGGGGMYIGINHSNCAGEEYDGDKQIADTLNMNYFELDEEMKYSSIQLGWFAVTRFVKWYNNKIE